MIFKGQGHLLEVQKKAEDNQKIADEKISEFSNNLFKVQKDNDELKGQIEALNDRIKDLNEDNDSLRNQIGEQKQQIIDHEEQFLIVKGKLKTTKEKLKVKTKQIAEIQETLEKCEKEKQELSKANTKLVNEKAELTNERDSLKTQLEVLCKEKAELENKEKVYQEKIEGLSEVLDATLQCHSELEENSQLKIAKKTKKIAEQKLECQKYRNEVTLTQNESAKAKKERDEALRKLVTEQLTHKVTNYNFNKVNADLEQEKTDHELTKINLDITNADLEQEKTSHRATRFHLSKRNFELRKIRELIRVELESKLKADEKSAQDLAILKQIGNNYNKLEKEAQAQRDKLKEFISRLSNINLQDPQQFKNWVLNLAKFANLDSKEQKDLEIKVSQIQQQLSSPTGLLSWKHLVLQVCNTLITAAIARKVC
ncbi:hypothetical protein [Candidatus Protochlamydia sp. R18]|uniref:hypothetical protein n=1 Tax=Candidatus Protochlamydia sp. R18 TaxID=1353977 RepID=UPI0005A6E33F|nr:hypothetical protein [Candidatus Protochlamydia sp. R18]